MCLSGQRGSAKLLASQQAKCKAQLPRGGGVAKGHIVTYPISRINDRALDMAQRWPKLIAFALGAASATGFEPLALWPITLIAFALLMVQLVAAKTARRAFGLGWAFGVGHFIVGLNWIATAFTYQAAMPAWLGWIAVVLLSLYLASYPALAAWGAWLFTYRFAFNRHIRASGDPKPNVQVPDSRLLALTFAALWIVTEWLRSWVFTGFAWNPLSATIPFFWSWTSNIGTYGLSAIVIFAAFYPIGTFRSLSYGSSTAKQFPEISERDQLKAQLGAGALLSAALAFIYFWPVNTDPRLSTPQPTVTIVQPNVGQQDKWKGEKADANFAKLAALTKPLSDEPRLILWPEAAIPDYLEAGYPWVYYDRSPAEARGRLTSLMNPGDLMLLGALKLEMDKAGEVVGARNAVMMVRPDGSLGPRYDKSHLVPYGEYLPMRPILSAIGLSRLAPGDLDFWPGPGPRTLDLGPFGKAGIQICYEIIFSGQVVDRANRPDFLFNPSNDAWFGSWGPPQHLAQARLRAIEEGLPVIRATPTGISAIIDADGRIVQSLPMGKAGRIDAQLPPPHRPTLFAQYGNILPLLFAALLLGLAIASARRRG